MKKILYVACVISLAALFSACNKTREDIIYPVLPVAPAPVQTPAIESDIKVLSKINYGTAGMCNYTCKTALKIDGVNAIYSETTGPNSGDLKSCQKSFNDKDIDDIRKLLNTKKMELVPEVTGCPMCADSEESVELVADGKTYKFRFSYNQVPKEIYDAVLKLRLLRQSFVNCK